MDNGDSVWLAADYHFPSTYSCRIPMSSMSSAMTMPAPGPGTVRLALIRTSIELFGVDYTRDELFPIIRSAGIRIRPPERVAISTQVIRAYKASPGKSRKIQLNESPVYREFAHAIGVMTVYTRVPPSHMDAYCEIMRAIGYWGQASSLACCTRIYQAVPDDSECAVPVNAAEITGPTQHFFSCFVSELRDAKVGWDESMPDLGKKAAIQIALYVWPMVVCERHSGGKILQRCSLPTNADTCSEVRFS
jgi:hypothetical protein